MDAFSTARLREARAALRAHADPGRAKFLVRFFKTGKGEYAEGDRFLGVTVPLARSVARQFPNLSYTDVRSLLTSPMHEERLTALLMLVARFERGDGAVRKQVYSFYLDNLDCVNNWDLVDLSADKIVGAYLFPAAKPRLLVTLTRSRNLWHRRIAIVATNFYIRRGVYEPTLTVSGLLVNDSHDLIHKATGWMLREVGKRSLATEERFLKARCREMPRTMLRYAVERFPQARRLRYLSGNV